MKPNSDAIQMLYQPTPDHIWLTDCFDETCTVGSGDYALAAGIPIEIGRLFAAAPDLLDLLCRALPYVEDAEQDPCNKPEAVRKLAHQIRAAIERAS